MRAAITNKQRYGANFYHTIGKMGGLVKSGGGFAKNPELARIAGQRGGKASRRRKPTTSQA
jgi:general stress protein YciG